MNKKSIVGVIEIMKDSRLKYEYSVDLGAFVLDRMVSIPYPHAYGFIPFTVAEDKDPVDFFLINMTFLPMGTHVNLEIIGVILMKDNGVEDHKIIASIKPYGLDKYWTDEYIREINNFLSSYKEGVELLGIAGKKEAIKIIKAAQKRYNDKGIYD